ncbi:MAG: methionine adenosyltransferase [Candidatus Omnitrophica bacterium]|jgi:S-adenosylmethionine synthetase|nr:methionine adenosyltransferase [Candidatus Omnitrophota bacterium]MDD3987840.1 methionine adenosyltransferase [Candidatus Omnitrophota bacterium]MDD4981186.1 methionine adenosyltransferase [Candidatus Omnitrophota bacterium]MDD5664696.1 methionine adenosyltransferase [Candidatus Omnitrophota bacterium]
MSRKYFFTSESVGEGHPDKVCDQISDAVLDKVLSLDKDAKKSRVACETYVTMGLLIVGGEITTNAYIDIQKLAREVVRDIGYTHPKYGFDYNTCAIVNTINAQSPDIAQGVNTGGAGDQGIMFGYACSETSELMPLPITLAHRLVKRMADVRRANTLSYLGPDCKSQVTVEYENGEPKRVDSVVIACQHTDDILDASGKNITSKARSEMIKVIAGPVLKGFADKNTKYFVNQTGKFVVGGPQSDTGMTGRKIVVDTYGGSIAHGGGAFSGKDPTKVDRSAAYMCRYIAKNIVAAKLAERFMVQLSYVIGYAEPLSIFVDTYGTGKISDDKLVKLIRQNFELTPKGIISCLRLLTPIYKKTACYGHFGRDGFSWEKTDKAAALKLQAGRL